MENFMEGYPVVIEVPIAWGEMDAFQHVNSTVYIRWFESVRVAYLKKINIFDTMVTTGIGPILASVSCKYKMPLKFPDSVLVGARVTKIGEDRFTMAHRIVSVKHQQIAAEGDDVIVTFDYRENRKVPIPADWRRLISDLEGKP